MWARHVYVRKTKHVYVWHYEIGKKIMISLWEKYSAKEKVYEKSDNSPIKIIKKCKKVEELILKK